MCQRRKRREQRKEGLLLLLLAGVLLLFPSIQTSYIPGCDGRLLPAFNGDVHGLGHAARRLKQVSAVAAPASSSSQFPEDVPKSDSSSNAILGPASSPTTSYKSTPVLWIFMIGPALFLFFLLVFIGIAIVLLLRRRRRQEGTSWKKGISDDENDQLEKSTFAGVPACTVGELEAACEEFTNIIGASSDCIVYKGIRPSDGVQIAVTRIRIPPSSWTANRELEFRRKVEDLARMNHDNLVNLLAYCTAEKPFERMLVFEYASNGTLYEHLHGNCSDEDHLDWAARMRIVMGAAFGLQYMHHELNPPASHFKFDASHVLLTEDYAAKVADFGISAISVDKKSLGRRRSFRRIVRAVGYPDWDGYRQVPYLESNIRSFGVFLLETISGRPPYTESQGPLIEWVKDYLNDSDRVWYLVDPSLKSYKKQELVDVCAVAALCIQPKASKLPSMRDVTEMLSKALKMTQEVANSKGSPLLWAELELLASIDVSLDDPALLASSPKQRSQSNTDLEPLTTTTGSTVPARPKLSKVISMGGGSNKCSNPYWADNASELELLSPQDEPEPGEEDPELPLAGSAAPLSSSSGPVKKPSSLVIGSQGSLGRNFRRVWGENELSKLELLSSKRGFSSDTDVLGR